MMKDPKFSIIAYLSGTDPLYFRDFLESVVNQDNANFELILLDDNPLTTLGKLSEEFFPGDSRLKYRKLKKQDGKAYALNTGLHFVSGDYVLFAGQHDRMSLSTLSTLSKTIEETTADVLYSDEDEWIKDNRMHPHFKPDFNKALFLQTNYIGDFVCFSVDAMRRVGLFDQKWEQAVIYQYLIRCMEKKKKIVHIPVLLFHRHIEEVSNWRAEAEIKKKNATEAVSIVQEYLRKQKIEAIVKPDPSGDFWKIRYDGSDYRRNNLNYFILKDKKVHVSSKKAPACLYGHLKQPDVAVVGCMFVEHAFSIENCGFIYGKDGLIYPACCHQRTFSPGYEYRIALSQDVSMVDFAYAMIDRKIFKHLRGFDPTLSGRDRILDYCLKAKKAGYRIVYEPAVMARNREKVVESSQLSHERLMKKWQTKMEEGDPFYNENLPVGVENYTLP